MSKDTKLKRKQEIARKKRNKKIIIISVSVVALALIVIGIIAAVNSARTETYGDGYQSIVLLPNGKFTAELSHGQSYSGTYSKSTQDGMTIVAFTYDGSTVVGEIEDGMLHIPHEWDDGHGHGSAFPKK